MGGYVAVEVEKGDFVIICLKYLANRVPNVRDSKPLSAIVTLSNILNLLVRRHNFYLL
jgi:hypothetical protein